jgi:membrane protein DedA with SNARE-associated domain
MIGHLLESYGYLAVLLLVGLESLGLPLPGETALLTASAYAAAGHLSIVGVVAAAVAGAVLGDAGAYWIGRTGGLALVRRYGHLLRIDDARLERAQGFYRRHGGPTVFFGRFVSLLRILAALLAGVTRMPYARFTLYNVAGGVCWATLFGTLGYGFGRQLPKLEHTVGQVGALLGLMVALLVVVGVVGPWLVHHAGDLVGGLVRAIGRIGQWTPVRQARERYPRAWAFVARRFAAGEYLGLHLTIGLVLSLGALWLFGGIAEDVIHHDPITQFDVTVANLLHLGSDGGRRFAHAEGVPDGGRLGGRAARRRPAGRHAEADLPPAAAHLGCPDYHRARLQLPQRPRDGVTGRLRHAGLCGMAGTRSDVGAGDAGRVYARAGPPHRPEPDVPRRPLLQRRDGRLRGGNRVAGRLHHRARGGAAAT